MAAADVELYEQDLAEPRTRPRAGRSADRPPVSGRRGGPGATGLRARRAWRRRPARRRPIAARLTRWHRFRVSSRSVPSRGCCMTLVPRCASITSCSSHHSRSCGCARGSAPRTPRTPLARVARVLGTEPRQRVAAVASRCGVMPPSPGSTISHEADTAVRIEMVRRPEHDRGRTVPGEDLGHRPEQVGRVRVNRVDQRDQLVDVAVELAGIGARDVVGKRELRPREGEQRPALRRVESQRAGERVEHLGRRVDVAPCSSHVYQDTPTPANAATSSRLSPGVRRRPPLSGSPTSAGDSRARRERRNARSSSRRVGEDRTAIVRRRPL